MSLLSKLKKVAKAIWQGIGPGGRAIVHAEGAQLEGEAVQKVRQAVDKKTGLPL